MSSHPKSRVRHDTAANTGQFPLAGRELAIVRLARLSCLFPRAADLGGYRSCRGDHYLVAPLAGWGSGRREGDRWWCAKVGYPSCRGSSPMPAGAPSPMLTSRQRLAR